MDCRIADLLVLLDRQLGPTTKIPKLAEHVGLSGSRLQHLFKQEVGLPIKQFLKTHQLSEAARLLRQTRLRVSEICYRVGFQDCSNFGHAFRERFGMSPRAYRSHSSSSK
jgi:AraC family transcriptional regulator of arabinose operon